MREAIKEYLVYSEQEKKVLWDVATFVFDTNVLLDIYRCSQDTRDLLLSAISNLKDRIFMPYHVAYEFMSRRCDVLFETADRYQDLVLEAEKFIKLVTSKLYLEATDPSIHVIEDQIYAWISDRQNSDLKNCDPQNDYILDTILKIYDGKIGEKYTDEQYKQLCTDGEIAFNEGLPPGFKDKKKKENGYGDFIIWREIIDYANKHNKDIIFVTRDCKEDWWLVKKGRTIGPHTELRKEFISKTNQKFYMYSTSSFLKYCNTSKSENSEKAISEVEKISASNTISFYTWHSLFENDEDEDKEIVDFLDNDKNILYKKNHLVDIYKKANQVMEKINRADNYLKTLYKKYPVEPRPADIQDLIINTEAKIALRKNQLDYLKSILPF